MESLRTKRWKILACSAVLFSSVACAGFGFAGESMKFVSYGIDRTTGDWRASELTLIDDDLPSVTRFDFTTIGVPCPTPESRLLIWMWIAFMEIAVVERFQEQQEWKIDGVNFTNKGLVNLEFLDLEINDGYLISVDWSDRGEIYRSREPASFQFIYSEKFGLISLIRARVAFERSEGDQGAAERVIVSSVYWASQLPAFQER